MQNYDILKKAQTYKYYLNDNELVRVSYIKDLGVYFDPSLSFNDHYVRMYTL
jgi:hypothetical protein